MASLARPTEVGEAKEPIALMAQPSGRSSVQPSRRLRLWDGTLALLCCPSGPLRSANVVFISVGVPFFSETISQENPSPQQEPIQNWSRFGWTFLTDKELFKGAYPRPFPGPRRQSPDILVGIIPTSPRSMLTLRASRRSAADQPLPHYPVNLNL